MQSQLQCVEIESALGRDYDLTIDYRILGDALEQSVVQLRKVAIERSRVAALNVERVCLPEYDRPEAVPLRFVEIIADGQLIRELGEHGFDWRFQGRGVTPVRRWRTTIGTRSRRSSKIARPR